MASGLVRLEQLHAAVNNESSSFDNSHRLVEIEWVRVTAVNDCYAVLRRIDAADGDKYIVLDFSTQQGLESVLRQVRATAPPPASC